MDLTRIRSLLTQARTEVKAFIESKVDEVKQLEIEVEDLVAMVKGATTAAPAVQQPAAEQTTTTD